MINKDVQCLVKYGKFFGNPQISLEPIRKRQDEKLASEIIKSAKNKLNEKAYNAVKEPSFFVGSVDFMVNNENNHKTFYVLEANGGSSRGFSALPVEHWKSTNKSYAQCLSFVQNFSPIIIIGHPNNDLLAYEKFFLAEQLVEEMKKKNSSSEVVHVDNLSDQRLSEGNLVIIGSYGKILPRLSVFKDNYVYFDGKQADVLIGDGIARRKEEITNHLLKKDLKTLVINDVFFITDDKALTYLAVRKSAHLLKDFDVEPIAFKRAKDRDKIVSIIAKTIEEIPEVLIKPHGGSGGSGIDIISNKEHIEKKVEGSISHYRQKFGDDRNPFPYTVCQRVHATPIIWNKALHHFDVRVYIGREKDKIIPLGALMRIALAPFTGQFIKKSFVVNLSGYHGVDTDRGLGVQEETLKLLNLNKRDFISMFSASCTLGAYINNNYSNLLKLASKDSSV